MSWTREILAAKGGGGVDGRSNKLKRRRARVAVRPVLVPADSPDTDPLACIDFGSRLMSLSELARASGIGEKFLRLLVRSGKLRPLRVPGGQRLRYSPRQLAEIIKRENQFCY